MSPSAASTPTAASTSHSSMRRASSSAAITCVAIGDAASAVASTSSIATPRSAAVRSASRVAAEVAARSGPTTSIVSRSRQPNTRGKPPDASTASSRSDAHFACTNMSNADVPGSMSRPRRSIQSRSRPTSQDLHCPSSPSVTIPDSGSPSTRSCQSVDAVVVAVRTFRKPVVGDRLGTGRGNPSRRRARREFGGCRVPRSCSRCCASSGRSESCVSNPKARTSTEGAISMRRCRAQSVRVGASTAMPTSE